MFTFVVFYSELRYDQIQTSLIETQSSLQVHKFAQLKGVRLKRPDKAKWNKS